MLLRAEIHSANEPNLLFSGGEARYMYWQDFCPFARNSKC